MDHTPFVSLNYANCCVKTGDAHHAHQSAQPFVNWTPAPSKQRRADHDQRICRRRYETGNYDVAEDALNKVWKTEKRPFHADAYNLPRYVLDAKGQHKEAEQSTGWLSTAEG